MINPIPCAVVESLHGDLAVMGLVGFPVALASELLRGLTIWPGELIWLIAVSCVGVNDRAGTFIAGLLAYAVGVALRCAWRKWRESRSATGARAAGA